MVRGAPRQECQPSVSEVRVRGPDGSRQGWHFGHRNGPHLLRVHSKVVVSQNDAQSSDVRPGNLGYPGACLVPGGPSGSHVDTFPEYVVVPFVEGSLGDHVYRALQNLRQLVLQAQYIE